MHACRRLDGITEVMAVLKVCSANARRSAVGFGLHNGSTEVTFLSQQVAIHAAVAHGFAAAAFYIDIASAFSEFQRCLVVDDLDSEERLRATLLCFCIDEIQVDKVVREVADAGFWVANGAPDHLVAQLGVPREFRGYI